MCVDYRDLNKAIPKDDFPLSHIDMLIGNTIEDMEKQCLSPLGNILLQSDALRLEERW